MNANGFLVTSGFLASGAVAGHAARRLLARLRRGAVFRPPGCELFAAMASGIVGWRVAVGALPAWWCAVPLLLGWLAVPLAAVDLVALRLPNALTYAAYPILGTALSVAAADGPGHSLVIRALLGAAMFGGAHALVRCFAPTALGAGDAKLAGSLGAVLGALGWQSLLLATALAATITLFLALTRRPHPNATQPLPPTHLNDAATTDRPPPDPKEARLTGQPSPTEPVQPSPAEPSAKPKLTPLAEPSEILLTKLQGPSPAEPPTRPKPVSPAEDLPTRPKPVSSAGLPTKPKPLPPAEALPTKPKLAPLGEATRARPREALRTEHNQAPAAESPKPVSPAESDVAAPTPGQDRIPLLRRAVPHGPGLLAATWLLATFPGQALIGGVTS
jgi:leader peptidase (prepilin peptidase)/N-methyltransferase